MVKPIVGFVSDRFFGGARRMPAVLLLVALVPRLVPSAVTGTASGFVNAFWQLGSVIVPLAVDGSYAATGWFMVAFATLATGPARGAAVMLAVRERGPDRSGAEPADVGI